MQFGTIISWLMIFSSYTNQFRSRLTLLYFIISVKFNWADHQKGNGKFWETWRNWITFQSHIINQSRDSPTTLRLQFLNGTWHRLRRNLETLNTTMMLREEKISFSMLLFTKISWNIWNLQVKIHLLNIPVPSIMSN